MAVKRAVRRRRVEELVVVEVEVDDRRQRPRWSAQADRAEGMRGRELEDAAAVVEGDVRRLVEPDPRRARRKVRRPPRGGGAVGVAEVCDRRHHLGVGVPAAAAEEPRLEALLDEPRPFGANLPGRVGAGGARVSGRRPVDVMTERPARGGLAGALDETAPILALGGRPHQPEAIRKPAGRRSINFR